MWKGGEFLKLKGSLKDQLAKSFPELSFDFNEGRGMLLVYVRTTNSSSR